MQLPQEHIDHIKTAFQKMSSIDDLLKLLNYSKKLVYGEEAIPFKLGQITWYSNPKLCKKRYSQFEIKKKSGKKRIIHAPVPGLRSIQKALNLILQCVFEPHKAATGFVMGKSIVDNASVHIRSNYVFNIDLKDFFPSIDQARVWKCLQLKPFSLRSNNEVNEDIQFNEDDSYFFEMDSSDKNFRFYYKNKNYKAGKRSFLTTRGYKITYSIPRNRGNSGYIFISKSTSDINAIKSFTENLLIEKNIDIPLERGIGYLIEAAIDKHQQTILAKKNIGLANVIASLCCTEMEVERKDKNGNWIKTRKNVLPQGAPTSPVLTNVICQRLDYLLTGVGKRFGLRYSRYADDITFSSMHNVYQKDGDFIKEVNRIITEQNFHIKESKTRLQKNGYRQEVTGLLVNDKVNVQKRYIKELRMWLYYWENYGYTKTYSYFSKHYFAEKGKIKRGNPDMASVIRGKLDYLKMVKGSENEMYLKLRGRFDLLTFRSNPILDIWEKEGIEKAMEIYYKFEMVEGQEDCPAPANKKNDEYDTYQPINL